MLGIENIIYENNNDIFYIDVSKKTLSYMNIKKEISENTIFNYLDKLFRIIDIWEEEYSDFQIIDKNSWKLLINYQDGRIKKHFGNSDYPFNFEAFEKLNQNLIREEF